jgi:solute carrier family 35, member F1/2
MVKDKDPTEFLGMLGINGAVIAAIQMTIFEISKIKSTEWNGASISFAGGYVLCLFCMYSTTSFFLKTSDAALFNLSLLTSDVYAVIFAFFMYGDSVHWLYYVAFSLTASGLVVYSTAGPMHSDGVIAIEELRGVLKGSAGGSGQGNEEQNNTCAYDKYSDKF